MYTEKDLDDAMNAAMELLRRAAAMKDLIRQYDGATYRCIGKENAALKRQSMEVTNAMVKLRQ